MNIQLTNNTLFFSEIQAGLKKDPEQQTVTSQITELINNPLIIKEKFAQEQSGIDFINSTYRDIVGWNSLLEGNGTSSRSFLNIGEVNTLIEELAQKVQLESEELSEAFSDPEMIISVEKLILDRLTGRQTGENIEVKLSSTQETLWQGNSALSMDISINFKELEMWKGSINVQEFNLEIKLSQINISSDSWKGSDIKGLRQIDAATIDTGRYLVGFQNITTLTIYDKHTSLSTTVWGDPHVDLSDQEGNLNGEFSDLKKSETLTTFVLLDGTEVVMTAPDNGVIESVDVFKNGVHAKGYGMGIINELRAFGAENLTSAKNFMVGGFFSGIDSEVKELSSLKEQSDVVKAGGDGNDWYDEKGRLVWGS